MHCDLYIGEKIEMEGRRIGEEKEVQILGRRSNFLDAIVVGFLVPLDFLHFSSFFFFCRRNTFESLT